MSKIRKPDNRIVGANPPVIKVDLTNRDFYVHLGPFMPFNSGGFAIPIETYHTVIKTNSTIRIAAPTQK